MEHFGDDLILIHNPRFKYRNREPYKLDQVVTIICEEGHAEGAVNLKPYKLESNTLLIVLSTHIMESYGVSDDYKGSYIFMSEKFLNRLDIGDSYNFYKRIEEGPLIHIDNRSAAALHSYMEMSRNLCQLQDSNPNTEEALRLLTKTFFLTIGWYIHRPTESQDNGSRQSDVMKQFIDLIKNNYKEHRDVNFYADEMNMTAKYLSAIVKQTSGKSALKWIEDYVILDAKAQLSSSMNSIQQISFNLNFPNQSFFGRYFKHIVGESPSEYRKRARGQIVVL